jgi:hypothetical protein
MNFRRGMLDEHSGWQPPRAFDEADERRSRGRAGAAGRGGARRGEAAGYCLTAASTMQAVWNRCIHGIGAAAAAAAGGEYLRAKL